MARLIENRAYRTKPAGVKKKSHYLRKRVGRKTHTYSTHVSSYLVEIFNFFFFWSMDDDNCGADDGEDTAYFPVKIKLLVE